MSKQWRDRAEGRQFLSFCRSWGARTGITFLVAMSVTVAYARDVKTIGVIVGDLGNPFFEKIGRGVEEAAARLVPTPVQVTVQSSGYDLNRQIEQVDEFIRRKTDLLIINAVDTQQIEPAVLRARSAGIVVIAVDVKATGADAAVTSDNVGAGVIACNYLAERLGGDGSVLIIDGPPVSSVGERMDGCRQALAKFLGIKILADDEDCGGSIEGGLSCMTDVLNRFARIDAVFAINDPTAIGADIAASRAGRSEFFIVSIDGSPRAAKIIAEAKTQLVATVSQDPWLMTETAVSMGLQLFRGATIVDGNVSTPVKLVTNANVGRYLGWDR